MIKGGNPTISGRGQGGMLKFNNKIIIVFGDIPIQLELANQRLQIMNLLKFPKNLCDTLYPIFILVMQSCNTLIIVELITPIHHNFP